MLGLRGRLGCCSCSSGSRSEYDRYARVKRERVVRKYARPRVLTEELPQTETKTTESTALEPITDKDVATSTDTSSVADKMESLENKRKLPFKEEERILSHDEAVLRDIRKTRSFLFDKTKAAMAMPDVHFWEQEEERRVQRVNDEFLLGMSGPITGSQTAQLRATEARVCEELEAEMLEMHQDLKEEMYEAWCEKLDRDEAESKKIMDEYEDMLGFDLTDDIRSSMTDQTAIMPIDETDFHRLSPADQVDPLIEEEELITTKPGTIIQAQVTTYTGVKFKIPVRYLGTFPSFLQDTPEDPEVQSQLKRARQRLRFKKERGKKRLIQKAQRAKDDKAIQGDRMYDQYSKMASKFDMIPTTKPKARQSLDRIFAHKEMKEFEDTTKSIQVKQTQTLEHIKKNSPELLEDVQALISHDEQFF